MKLLGALLLLPLVHLLAQTTTTPSVDGIWLGTIGAGNQRLRIQVHIQSDAGKLTATLDSIDQGVTGLPCAKPALSGTKFSFEVPAVNGYWNGTLSASGNDLTGTWMQGAGSTPLTLTRQASAIAILKLSSKYEEVKPPVPLEQLKQALDADLAGELKTGNLSAESAAGVVIGVIQQGKRMLFTYGPVKEDSIFEIGSITKTFTALILARMVAENEVTLNQPLRDFLPAGTVTKPSGSEITLLDLATQHSNLPRLPDNLAVTAADPYADYSPKKLYEYLAKQGVGKPDHVNFLYSNLGFGALGQALANKAGMGYADLLKQEVTKPLSLPDTVVTLSDVQEKRFAAGHDAAHHKASPWTFDALSGAGAIRSTAADLLTYLEAQLHPERFQSHDQSMAAAIQSVHELRDDAQPGMKIGLAWLQMSKLNWYWHNGATGGYSSYCLFSPDDDLGVVVLYNTTLTEGGSFADRLGEHIAERVTGKPALRFE